MKRLTLIGTKEFSQQILYCSELCKEFEFIGYFDDLVPKGTLINGKPVLGTVDEAIELYREGLYDYIFIAIGYTRFDLREYYYSKLKGVVPLANIIMNESIISDSAILGEGVFIGARSIIGNNCLIEDNVFMWGDCYIAHDNIIRKHSYLAGRIDTAGFCEIGERNFIGIRSLISDHVKISNDVWIGLGCIITKNVKDPGKYMSNSKLYKIE